MRGKNFAALVNRLLAGSTITVDELVSTLVAGNHSKQTVLAVLAGDKEPSLTLVGDIADTLRAKLVELLVSLKQDGTIFDDDVSKQSPLYELIPANLKRGKTFSNLVDTLLIGASITVSELVDQLVFNHHDEQTVVGVLAGDAVPNLQMVEDIAATLDVSLTRLLTALKSDGTDITNQQTPLGSGRMTEAQRRQLRLDISCCDLARMQ